MLIWLLRATRKIFACTWFLIALVSLIVAHVIAQAKDVAVFVSSKLVSALKAAHQKTPKLKIHLLAFQKTFHYLVIFIFSFVITFIVGSINLLSIPAGAGDGHSANSGGILSVNISNQNVQLPSVALGTLSTATISATVDTNNATGYAISIRAKDPDNPDLTHSNGSDKISSSANPTPDQLAVNTWGFNIASIDDPSPTTFKRIPIAEEVLKTSSHPVVDDTISLVFGVNADFTMSAGVYETELVLSVTANYVPIMVSSIFPSSGVWEGDTITLTGQYLDEITNISVGGLACTNIIEVSATEVRCDLPAHIAGSTQSVVVTTLYGSSNTDKTVKYLGAPVISNLSPNQDLWAGETITITGSALSHVTQITVGSTACLGYESVSSTQITCIVPENIEGEHIVTVTTVGGTSNQDKPIAYRNRVSPKVNWTGGDIYIEGNNFTTSTTATVGGTACQSTKYVSDSLLRCTLPDKPNGSDQHVIAGGQNLGSVHYDGISKGNMQDFRWEQCESLSRGQTQIWTDSRNSQTYRIKKMPDGKCWMLDNLRYAYGTELSGTDTSNNDTSHYINPGAATNASYCAPGANLSTCYGYLYNFMAATNNMGSNSITDGDMNANICPNSSAAGSNRRTNGGWRLPRDSISTNSDLGILNTAMAEDDASSTNYTPSYNGTTDPDYKNNWYPTGSFQGVYSGQYSSGLTGQGIRGSYWSASLYSTSESVLAYFDNDNIYYSDHDAKSNALALRCVVSAPDPEPDFINWTGGDIYIEGTGFASNTTANIGSTSCTQTKFISSSLLRCTLPPHIDGAIKTISTSAGTVSTSLVEYDGRNQGNMQDFRWEQCESLSRGQAQIWTDSRNSQTYRIKKMPDGKCWMLDNLRYTYGTKVSGTMTSSSSVAQYADPGSASDPNYCPAGADLSTCYGYLYNWFGATYGTGLASLATGGLQVYGSICPNFETDGSVGPVSGGWRLPSSLSGADSPTAMGTLATKADYPVLNAAIANDDGTTTSWTGSNANNATTRPAWQPKGPFQGVFAGRYYAGLSNQGTTAYYLSSTVRNTRNARSTMFTSSSITTSNSTSKSYGYALRCVISEPEIDTNWTGGDIYVDGQGFDEDTVALIGGTACQSTKYISDTRLRCTLPAKPSGSTQPVTVSSGTTSYPGVLYDGANKGDMQSFRVAQCNTMPRGKAEIWTDSRDGQTYRIKKMPDGKCWMIDNLRFAYGDIKNDDTAMANDNAYYADPGIANSGYCPAGADLSTCYGYLYNWFGATYGTGIPTLSTNGNHVVGNICPNSEEDGSRTATTNGWRIPGGRSTAGAIIGSGTSFNHAAYAVLNVAMAEDDGGTTVWTGDPINTANTRAGWQPNGSFQGAFSGYYSSGLSSQGLSAHYWTNTNNTINNAYFLQFDPSDVFLSGNTAKANGLAVRCVVHPT